ncbi:MAG: winged helix-turn-helix domain-containing protein [Acidimicrobiia bacterium]|nr:MAG: winged helix-turn-helix domain-containing protein [Acidimicrobiia bacterium]
MTEANQSHWTFLTNHSHVLLCVAADPDVRLRDVAEKVGITERAAQRIVAELESEGYLSHVKVGRRNHYEVHTDMHLRHPLEDHLAIGALLRVLVQRD